MSTTETPKDGATKAITLRIPETLDQKVETTAAEVGLSRADVIRLSLDRGMDRLLEQLRGDAGTKSAA